MVARQPLERGAAGAARWRRSRGTHKRTRAPFLGPRAGRRTSSTASSASASRGRRARARDRSARPARSARKARARERAAGHRGATPVPRIGTGDGGRGQVQRARRIGQATPGRRWRPGSRRWSRLSSRILLIYLFLNLGFHIFSWSHRSLVPTIARHGPQPLHRRRPGHHRPRSAEPAARQAISASAHCRPTCARTWPRRRAALNETDIAILCLPDAAARDAVAMIEKPLSVARHRCELGAPHQTRLGLRACRSWTRGRASASPSATRVTNCAEVPRRAGDRAAGDR